MLEDYTSWPTGMLHSGQIPSACELRCLAGPFVPTDVNRCRAICKISEQSLADALVMTSTDADWRRERRNKISELSSFLEGQNALQCTMITKVLLGWKSDPSGNPVCYENNSNCTFKNSLATRTTQTPFSRRFELIISQVGVSSISHDITRIDRNPNVEVHFFKMESAFFYGMSELLSQNRPSAKKKGPKSER